MLEYSDLTVVNNSAGVPTALGYPINSTLLQNNDTLLVGGGGGRNKNLAVPAGLVCITETTCSKVNAYSEEEVVPDGLYERLLELAETKPLSKKMTRRKKEKKNKTHRAARK